MPALHHQQLLRGVIICQEGDVLMTQLRTKLQQVQVSSVAHDVAADDCCCGRLQLSAGLKRRLPCLPGCCYWVLLLRLRGCQLSWPVCVYVCWGAPHNNSAYHSTANHSAAAGDWRLLMLTAAEYYSCSMNVLMRVSSSALMLSGTAARASGRT